MSTYLTVENNTQDSKGCRWRLEQIFCLFWFESVTRSCVSSSLIWAAELSDAEQTEEKRCSTKWQLLSHIQTPTACSRVQDAEFNWENDLLIHRVTEDEFKKSIYFPLRMVTRPRNKNHSICILVLVPNTIYTHKYFEISLIALGSDDKIKNTLIYIWMTKTRGRFHLYP